MDSRQNFTTAIVRASHVLVGFSLILAVQLAYFAWSGRLQEYVAWSFLFPLFYFPSNLQWIAKLYTKLLWLWLLIATAITLSLNARVRRSIYGDERIWLLLLFGFFGLFPLLKLQASHYAFPGVSFLLVYSSVVLSKWSAGPPHRRERSPVPIAGILAAACAASAVLYQPAILGRLYRVRSFAEDRALRTQLQSLVTPSETAIFFNSNLQLYWASERYPNWPILHTDVQATYFIRAHSGELLNALRDPRLALVEFDPRNRSFGDFAFLDSPIVRGFVDALHCELNARFIRQDAILPPYVLWTPREESARFADITGCPPV
jgi:hypothetical protein